MPTKLRVRRNRLSAMFAMNIINNIDNLRAANSIFWLCGRIVNADKYSSNSNATEDNAK